MSARVVVVALASDFGCQVQMTNMEDHLLDVLGTFELSYWQLASSGHMPSEYDVAIVEGAVTTGDHVALLERVRATASTLIAIGSCAVSGGIPGLAARGDLTERTRSVYGDTLPAVTHTRAAPAPVSAVVEVDYHVPGCPIEPAEFLAVLRRAFMGLANRPPREPLCAACKIAENACFYEDGLLCLGLVTRTGCEARCVSLGRPCAGCRGIAEDANLPAAREVLVRHGLEPSALDVALDLFNSTSGVR
ncbi:MAG TPA: NADH:ubiquinone oxidoreductase [Coriobacteriia bacterium]|nr:NADH:ubiquinone oxidoreductase [Coriobacteriia bacterium]